jgi:hypothetical protein
MTIYIKPAVKKDFIYAESKIDQVKEILRQNAMKIVKIEAATPDEDMKQSTDLKVNIKGGDVAARVRRPYRTFRDLTIRAYKNGNKTEIDKLREGYADWYLYAWENEFGTLSEWILVDINKMRSSGLLFEQRTVRMNGDGRTGFVTYSIEELVRCGALVAKRISL